MIRARKIVLDNFKNVNHGEINFVDSASGASILGIYGQNGSGKTSIIDALGILRQLMSGMPLSEDVWDCISCSSPSFSMAVSFEVSGEDSPFAETAESGTSDTVVYSVEVARSPEGQSKGSVSVVAEKIKAKIGRGKMRTVAEWRCDAADTASMVAGGCAVKMRPEKSWKSYLSVNKDAKFALAVGAYSSLEGGRSLLFSRALAQCLIATSRIYREKLASFPDIPGKTGGFPVEAFFLINPLLMEYAREKLVVLTTSQSAFTSLDVLPLASSERGMHSLASGVMGDFIVPTSEPFDLSCDAAHELALTVDTINEVMPAIVPGLMLELNEIASKTLDDGSRGIRAELLSVRDGRRLPLRTESEGVRKIAAMLGLLIQVYGDESITVAIDELDSGVFEFLLGEVVEVLRDHAKGQLIFTAHNLRPLECLSPHSLVFTTTNPDNRYISFSGIKSTHNLRDRYLRTINLGGQSEVVYEPTNKIDINAAFFKANNDLSDEGKIIEALLEELGDACA